MLGTDFSLTQLVATMQQTHVQVARHQGVLEPRTIRDIRRTACMVMARTRRKAGSAEAQHKLVHRFSSDGPKHRQKAIRMQAFVKAHCPGVSHFDFLDQFDKAWAEHNGESLLACTCYWKGRLNPSTDREHSSMLSIWSLISSLHPWQIKSMRLMPTWSALWRIWSCHPCMTRSRRSGRQNLNAVCLTTMVS